MPSDMPTSSRSPAVPLSANEASTGSRTTHFQQQGSLLAWPQRARAAVPGPQLETVHSEPVGMGCGWGIPAASATSGPGLGPSGQFQAHRRTEAGARLAGGQRDGHHAPQVDLGPPSRCCRGTPGSSRNDCCQGPEQEPRSHWSLYQACRVREGCRSGISGRKRAGERSQGPHWREAEGAHSLGPRPASRSPAGLCPAPPGAGYGAQRAPGTALAFACPSPDKPNRGGGTSATTGMFPPPS